MAQSDPNLDTLSLLQRKHYMKRRKAVLLDRYYDGENRLERIGIAVPPELEMFKAAVNVPRMAVDEVVARQNLRSFQRKGGIEDEALSEAWTYNNLASRSMLVHQEARIQGESFVSVSSNADDAEMPLITVETGIVADVTPRGAMRCAARFYHDDVLNSWTPVRKATLYLPNSTTWYTLNGGRWTIDPDIEPDYHDLGRVPLVMFLNRARAGKWDGKSEMADVLEKTDAIARLISNMQVAGEALAWPKRWAAGVSKDDFVDKDGKPIPVWEAYMTAIMATGNKDASFGSFTAADLANFHKAVDALLSWCAAELGLPLRFLGQQSVNPASEGAIIADESRLVRNVERKNLFDGDSWSWVMGLWERFRTGEWPKGNPIRTIWFDPATPTQSQIADRVVKFKGANILSREGSWDEMGWDDARKDRERAYFAAEANDPLLQLAADLVGSGSAPAPASVGTSSAAAPVN